MSMEQSDIKEKAWEQGVFLELQTPDGAMESPMWVSVRDKSILTKQINQASVFEGMETAIAYLHQMPTECFPADAIIVPMVRTYNKTVHAAFWERLALAKKEVGDYSTYLIEAEHKMEQLQKALLNGPTDLAKPLTRELHTTILDLAIAVDRHLNTKQGE